MKSLSIALLCSAFALPAVAGGVFGEATLIAPQAGATPKSAEQALREFDRSLSAVPAPQPSRPLSTFEKFETLQAGKSSAALAAETDLLRNYGVEFSNICLTAKGACTVAVSSKGSSCFCGENAALTIGVVQ